MNIGDIHLPIANDSLMSRQNVKVELNLFAIALASSILLPFDASLRRRKLLCHGLVIFPALA
jgi:hypothetical protein